MDIAEVQDTALGRAHFCWQAPWRKEKQDATLIALPDYYALDACLSGNLQTLKGWTGGLLLDFFFFHIPTQLSA